MTDLELVKDFADKGVGKLNVEAKLGRKMTPDELIAFRSAVADRQLRLAIKRAAGPKSVAERVREHVARVNDIGTEVNLTARHPRLKEKCRYDLEAFGWYYCRRVLRHRASAEIRDGLIRDIQDSILNGGQSVKEYGRGTGKTTWIVYIGIVWAILYGHRRYPVIISATSKLAKKNLKTIKKLLTRSDEILEDFPEIAYPLRRIGDVSQRSASQTFNGQPTDIEWSTDQIVLPMLRDSAGNPLGPGCGAIVGSVGIGGAVRGSNEGGQRPDYLAFDDPQTKKIAHSPSLVQDVIDYIHQDALQLAGHDSVLSAFVTITPQCYGDVATELTSQTKHPEWSVTVEPFVSSICPRWNDLVVAFCAEYTEDAANHDFKRSRSTSWYVEHREEFAGVTVLDGKQFDPLKEVDAIHHVLNLRAKLGETAFNAEIMMHVSDADSELSINADLVAGKVNGCPRGVLPPGFDSAVGFVDLNIRRGKGLSWGIVAFGPKRTAAIVAYGRYPERGPVVDANASYLARNRAVAAAINVVVGKIMALNLRDVSNRRITLRALGFDRGYLPDVIHRSLYVLRKTGVRIADKKIPIPFPLVAVRGFPWNKFGTRKSDMLRRGDHIFATRSQYGEYLAEMAPYWREVMQGSLVETPLMPGSLSFYGRNPVEHFEAANEICAEKLIRKYVVESHGRSETAWDWMCSGDNHFCDVFTGCFAVASWFHCYDALSSVIDSAAATGEIAVTRKFRTVAEYQAEKQRAANAEAGIAPHVHHQDDLFDPRQNPAISAAAGYDGASDETEGTGDADVAAFHGDEEHASDPLVDADPRPRAAVKSLRTGIKQPVRFKRGRWKR